MAKNGIPTSPIPATQHIYIQAGKPFYTATGGIFGRSVKYVPVPIQYVIPITAQNTVIHVPKGWSVQVIKNPAMYYPPMAAPQTAKPAHHGHYLPSHSPQPPQQQPGDALRNEYNRLWQQDASINQDHVLETVATCLRPSLQKKGFQANTVSEAKTVIQKLKNEMALETIRHVEDLVQNIDSHEQYSAFKSREAPQTSKAPHHTGEHKKIAPRNIETAPASSLRESPARDITADDGDITDEALADESGLLTIAGRNIFDTEETTESTLPTVAASSTDVIDDPTLAEQGEIAYPNDTIEMPATGLSPVGDPTTVVPTPPPQEQPTQKTTIPLAPIDKETPVAPSPDKASNQPSSTKIKPEIPQKPEHLARTSVEAETTVKQPSNLSITIGKTPAASSLPETTAEPLLSTTETNTEKANNRPDADTQTSSPKPLDNRGSAQVRSGVAASANNTRHQNAAALQPADKTDSSIKAENQVSALQADPIKTTAPPSDSRPPLPDKSLFLKFKAFISQLFQKQSKTDTDLARIESSSVKSPSSIASSNASDIADLASLEEESSDYTVADANSQSEPIDTLYTSDIGSGYDEDEWNEWDDDDDDFEEWSESSVENAVPSTTYENTNHLNSYENISKLQTYENLDALAQPDVDKKATTTESPQESPSHAYENLRVLNEPDATPAMPDTVAAPKPSELNTDTETLNSPRDEQGSSSMSAFEASIKAAVEAREQRQKTKTLGNAQAQNTATSGKTNPPESPNEPLPSNLTVTSPDSNTEHQPEKNTDVDSESLSQANMSKVDLTLPKAKEPKDNRALTLEAIRSQQYKLKPVGETTKQSNAPTGIQSIHNSIVSNRGALDGGLAEKIEELFDDGYESDSKAEEATHKREQLVGKIKRLILSQNSELPPEQVQNVAQKIYDLDNKTIGEIEDIIDEMGS
ncbi:hypothetical protein [Kistimonas asteriae]|uniref:hypothetical protein n=1 Tax=Kistimonas asteriae TaxID=517724 RepID=UPI001BAB493F|nr:hypothetical protein [Kistimonas asteriae]